MFYCYTCSHISNTEHCDFCTNNGYNIRGFDIYTGRPLSLPENENILNLYLVVNYRGEKCYSTINFNNYNRNFPEIRERYIANQEPCLMFNTFINKENPWINFIE